MKIKPKINNFFKNNSSTILTVIGSVGVVVTAVMSARDTVKAVKRINYQRGYQDKEFNTKEKIKIAAPCYIPTVLSGVSTILCVCSANKINKNMQKSLTSAYILLDQSYKEYRNSVKKVFGEEGQSDVVKVMSAEHIDEDNLPVQDGKDKFFDYFSLQIFESSLSRVLEAERAANEMLKGQGYVSLRTLYSLMGQPVLGTDNLLGWSIGAGEEYGYDKVEIETTLMKREDGSIYYILDLASEPTADYLYFL